MGGGGSVTASLKGSHAQVSRQGSPHSRTVFWVQVKGNLSPMKYQEPWQEQWARSQEPQGQEETFQTCGEDSGQALAYGPRLCPLLGLCNKVTNVALKGSTHLCILLL